MQKLFFFPMQSFLLPAEMFWAGGNASSAVTEHTVVKKNEAK